MHDGPGQFIASGLKASTFLLPACLIQFTKPPVTRLRIVIGCRYTMTCCISRHWSSKRDEKEREASLKITSCVWGQDLMETGKREWRIKRKERRKPKCAKETSCLWSFEVLKPFQLLQVFISVAPIFSSGHWSNRLCSLTCLWQE